MRPRHVSIIMDGNGRWAKKRFLPRTAGHRSAISRVRDLIQCSAKKGIEALTLYTFSQENWQRPDHEVSFLMNLCIKNLVREMGRLHQNNVQIKVIGDRARLSSELLDSIEKAENLTENNSGLKLRLAINYSGKWDILNAMKACLTTQNQADMLSAESIEPYLSTSDCPPVDLYIRTGGQKRLSDFLLWQCAYAELYFTDTLFPDFSLKAFEASLEWFAGIERRFGMTSEQIRETERV